jgi:phage tail sheath protein FI
VIPVHLVTHHRNLEGVLELSRSIDKSFDGGNIQNAEKGVITAILNKRIALEMWWGQSLTTLDKFSRWVVSRSSNLLHDSIGLLNANIEPISHLLGSRKLF